MAKCSVCKNNIETTFLSKILGTYVKNEKGKKYPVCFECQKNLKDKDKILGNIK